MRILGIETSCDETALALIEGEGEIGNARIKILGETLFSQADLHKEYGGIFPALAKREHAKNLIPLLQKLLKETNELRVRNHTLQAKKDAIEKILKREPELLTHFLDFIPTIEKPAIEDIAVTIGPGLEPALWVGINFAYALKETWGTPVIPINHMEGHIVASLVSSANYQQFITLRKIKFPAVALLVSGGHTELVLMKDWMHYEIIGQTRDDAVGEAFDKTARLLGLPYPGGARLSRLAVEARAQGIASTQKLPRPMRHSGNLDFSFSGLKTAVLYNVKKIPALTENIKKEIAREFEDAVTEVLVSKTQKAVEGHNARTLILGGGVTANNHIRHSFEMYAKEEHLSLLTPDLKLTTDNALMIALAGYFHAQSGAKTPSWEEIRAWGNLRLSTASPHLLTAR